MVITNVNQVVYQGDGVTTAFPFTFTISSASEVYLQLVHEDDTVTTITQDFYVDVTNNTVHYPGYAPGSEPPEVNRPPKVQTGEELVIYRDVPMTQEINLGDKWPFVQIEFGLDKLTMICQQIYSFTNRKLDAALASMFQLAGIVTDSGKLQHITDQLNAIDDRADDAQDSADAAATSESNALSYRNAAQTSAAAAAASASEADTTATALTTWLADKETLTAPAVDRTLSIAGAAADAKVTGDVIFGGAISTETITQHHIDSDGTLIYKNAFYIKYFRAKANVKYTITNVVTGNLLQQDTARIGYSATVPTVGVTVFTVIKNWTEASTPGTYTYDVELENDGYIAIGYYGVTITAESFDLYDTVVSNNNSITSLNNDVSVLNSAIKGDTVIVGNSLQYLYINSSNVFYGRSPNVYTDYYWVNKGVLYEFSCYTPGNMGLSDSPILAMSDVIPATGVSVDRMTVINTGRTGEYSYTFKAPKDGYFCVAHYYTLTMELRTVSAYGTDTKDKNIYVDPNGYGNYTSLVTALKSIQEGEKVNVYVSEGTYTLSDEWTTEELDNANYPSGFCGTFVPKNVNIIGVGSRDKIIIQAESNGNYTYNNTWRHISTLNPLGNNLIENVTVIGKGLRYPIHEDFGSAMNTHQRYINCVVDFFASSSGGAIGCGAQNGASYLFKDCYIKGSLGMHGNSEMISPPSMLVDGCIITGRLSLTDYYSKVRFPILVKNSLVGKFAYGKYDSTKPQYMDIQFLNGNVPMLSSLADVVYTMDNMEFKGSRDNISRGKPVKRSTDPEFVSLMQTNDDIHLFYGIALEDIPAFVSGGDFIPKRIVTKGYISTAIIGLSSFQLHDLIGVVNGNIAVVTDNAIGIVEFVLNDVGYIRLF